MLGVWSTAMYSLPQCHMEFVSPLNSMWVLVCGPGHLALMGGKVGVPLSRAVGLGQQGGSICTSHPILDLIFH